MTNLFIPVGIPGCGKSSYGRLFFNRPGCLIESTDAIREALGDVSDQSRNDLVFETYHGAIHEGLADGFDIYADATNLTRRAREQLTAIALRTHSNMHLIIFTDCGAAVRRNSKRERVVPQEAMVRMLDQYEQFMLDLPFERAAYTTITKIGSFE